MGNSDKLYQVARFNTELNKILNTSYEVKQSKIDSYVKSGRLNKVEINALD